ncbi:MAG TPA: PH domain-containing protein [Opitutales bacterium]|nr:PH domain-containing protein [Opitutales bacterium]
MDKKVIVVPTPLPGSFAYRFQELLAKKHWTEKQFIQMSRMRVKHVSDIKMGGIPTLVMLTVIAKTFGITVDELMAGVRRTQFSAPLGRFVKIVTLVTTVIVLAVGFFPYWLLTALLYLVFLACLFTSVQGYEVRPGELVIQRLAWKTRIPLAGLKATRAAPGLMKGAIRLFGSGGLFAFTGWFRSRDLGSFRAWATDLDRTVLLDLGTRKIVVSPDSPEQFVEAVNEAMKTTPEAGA